MINENSNELVLPFDHWCYN